MVAFIANVQPVVEMYEAIRIAERCLLANTVPVAPLGASERAHSLSLAVNTADAMVVIVSDVNQPIRVQQTPCGKSNRAVLQSPSRYPMLAARPANVVTSPAQENNCSYYVTFARRG